MIIFFSEENEEEGRTRMSKRNQEVDDNDSCKGSESDHEGRKKRPRTAFTASQVKALESEFERNKYLSVAKRSHLAKSLKLTETQVNYCCIVCCFLGW